MKIQNGPKQMIVLIQKKDMIVQKMKFHLFPHTTLPKQIQNSPSGTHCRCSPCHHVSPQVNHCILRENAPVSHHIVQFLDCQCQRFQMITVEAWCHLKGS